MALTQEQINENYKNLEKRHEIDLKNFSLLKKECGEQLAVQILILTRLNIFSQKLIEVFSLVHKKKDYNKTEDVNLMWTSAILPKGIEEHVDFDEFLISYEFIMSKTFVVVYSRKIFDLLKKANTSSDFIFMESEDVTQEQKIGFHKHVVCREGKKHPSIIEIYNTTDESKIVEINLINSETI